jgi:hypothetical protein
VSMAEVLLGRSHFAFADGWERRVICIRWLLGRGDRRTSMFVLQVAFVEVKQATLAKVGRRHAGTQRSLVKIGSRSADGA